MKPVVGVTLMVLGVIGIARGSVVDQGLQSMSHALNVTHSTTLAALLGAFFFVGGLMILAKRDSFSADARFRFLQHPPETASREEKKGE